MNATPTVPTTPATGSSAPNVAYAVVDSPIGPLTLVATDDALVELRFPNHDDGTHPCAAALPGSPDPGHPVLSRAAVELAEYFAGERTDFDIPLAPVGTAFQLDAWTTLRTIPYGETVSYGEQARRLGAPNKARAVGAANGRNPIPVIVPCHRVIGANGRLTGFGGGVESKAWLLTHEQQVRART
ncbi:methylated-DNA--[protein]-cysteine S-methyltransferase [soil metagenome]